MFNVMYCNKSTYCYGVVFIYIYDNFNFNLFYFSMLKLMTPSLFCGKPTTRRSANLLGEKHKLTFLIFIKILLDQARSIEGKDRCSRVPPPPPLPAFFSKKNFFSSLQIEKEP